MSRKESGWLPRVRAQADSANSTSEAMAISPRTLGRKRKETGGMSKRQSCGVGEGLATVSLADI